MGPFIDKAYKEQYGAAQQAAFDKAVRGLASQNFERCVNAEGVCMYKHGERRCAFGWLMENPSEDFHGDASDYASNYFEASMILGTVSRWFSLALQKAHDNAYLNIPRKGMEDRPLHMVRNLYELAETYGLNPVVLVDEAKRLGYSEGVKL